METKESKETRKSLNIHDRLANIQSEVHAPKDQYNAFGKYKYRSAENILEAVKPLLKKEGCTLTLNDEIVLIGQRFYVKATATLYNGAECIVTSAYAREDDLKKGMDGSQVTGASSSYARKYALNGLFAIDDTKDADALNDNPDYASKKEETKPVQKLTFKPLDNEVYWKMIDAQIKGQVSKSGETMRDWYAKYTNNNAEALKQFDADVANSVKADTELEKAADRGLDFIEV